MVNNEPQTQDILGDPNQTSAPSKNSGSQENSHFRRRGPDRRPEGYESAPGKDTDLKEREGGSEEEETEPERSSSQQRHHRGGRPEKRIIEESAYDPYCE